MNTKEIMGIVIMLVVVVAGVFLAEWLKTATAGNNNKVA